MSLTLACQEKKKTLNKIKGRVFEIQEKEKMNVIKDGVVYMIYKEKGNVLNIEGNKRQLKHVIFYFNIFFLF